MFITFDTYPPMFVGDKENINYDSEYRLFTVPTMWFLEEFKVDNFGCSDIETFLREYTWDDTFFLYERALSDDVIIYDEIAER